MDDKLSEGIRLIRQWHYEEVRSIADSAIEACVGREQPARADARMVWKDALLSDREEEAQRILDGEREHGRVERVNREREVGEDPREFLTEWVDNVTDNHQHITYTAQAKALLLASDNESAYEDEMGEAPEGPMAISAQACMALRRDVWDLLDAREDEWCVEDEEPEDEDAEDEDEDAAPAA